MALADDVVAALPELRAMAESRMLDTFDIKVPTGGTVYDPYLQADVDEYDFLFSTKGRVKVGAGLATRESEAGGRTIVSVTRELHIPVTSAAVPAGAVAFVTSVHATSDPSLAGARLRLTGPAPGSQTTARRLEVSEVLT